MHRRLQFGMRENPASDRRHGSRLAVSLPANQNHVTERKDTSLLVSPDNDRPYGHLNTSCHAEPQGEATGGENGGARKPPLRESCPHKGPSRIERPLTSEEAAELVRVHPKTVKRMARAGELPGHFRFGRWFFYASELDSWMRTDLNSVSHS
jgi:excisionase family DNA binding protein